jgi:hypothetical protein
MLTEQELIPAMLSEHFPALMFKENVAGSRYGFMYTKQNQNIPNLPHGPAILRLEYGSIAVINQDMSWAFNKEKNCTCQHCTAECAAIGHRHHLVCRCQYRSLVVIPISTNSFISFKPIIDVCIMKWHEYHKGCSACAVEVDRYD